MEIPTAAILEKAPPLVSVGQLLLLLVPHRIPTWHQDKTRMSNGWQSTSHFATQRGVNCLKNASPLVKKNKI